MIRKRNTIPIIPVIELLAKERKAIHALDTSLINRGFKPNTYPYREGRIAAARELLAEAGYTTPEINELEYKYVK